MKPSLLRDAVRENVSWCALVGSVHGVGAHDDGRVWVADGSPPPHHPDAVTLLPGVAAAEVLRALEGRRPCSVKDSFADLDLAATGLDVLFDATWIGTVDALPVAAGLLTAVVVTAGPDLGPDVAVLDVLHDGATVGRGTGHRHDAVIDGGGAGYRRPEAARAA